MEVIKVNVQTESHSFWNALKIYHQQPKSINKQVLFSEDVYVAELQSLSLNDCLELFNTICSKALRKGISRDFFKNVDFRGGNAFEEREIENVFTFPYGKYLIVRKLIPKLNINDDFEYFEFIFVDKSATKVYIFTKMLPVPGSWEAVQMEHQDAFVILKFSFLQLVWNDSHLEIFYNKELSKKGITWLQATFAPKFQKLCCARCEYGEKKNDKLEFFSKVNVVQYYKLYEEMKSKYAKYFIDNWTENTDPKKFVYEDIGIAAYLMMLWNGGEVPNRNSKKQKFLDLGCGNGLLVHILNSEGHLGVGIDMRRRKIWDIYPTSTVLKEEVIIPTSKMTYLDMDWLIGNHSDELTAWIPIMARLCNSHCQYFVLPCCAYQLNGMKFQRKNSSFSSYHSFINYTKEISQLCLFATYIDKLRIPSTKRICLVGINEVEHLEEKYISLKEEINRFIGQQCPSLGNKNSGETGALNLKLRESVEPVRNCTKLPKEFIESSLKAIMNELLKEQVTCLIIKDGNPCTWNRGRKLSIEKLASCLNKMLLSQLKNECKGLQTLLKNHHFLFEVSQGFVQFRSPESMLVQCNKFLECKNETKWKVKKCWFFNNHPDKCPLSSAVCSYSHNECHVEI